MTEISKNRALFNNGGSSQVKKENQFLATVKRLFENKAAVVGAVILILLVLGSVLAPWIAPYPYEAIDTESMFLPPSLKHPFGTDQLGRDIFSRMLYGGRYSLRIGVYSMLLSTLGGLFIGSIAGFFGGTTDQVIMRLCDVVQAVPGIVLNIALSCVFGAGFWNCILALGFSSMAGSARMIRSSILKIRKIDYLDAATAINCSNARIIIKHILPNAIAPVIVQSTMGVAGCIMGAAQLSYLGLGVQPPLPEWGAMLSAGRGYIDRYPYMTLIPGLVIMVTVLSLNLVGDGLRDAMDPKLKK